MRAVLDGLSALELVSLARSGDRDAWAVLYRRYAPQMLRSAVRRVDYNRPLAEDIVAETWATAMGKLAKWDGGNGYEQSFIAWMYGIMRVSSIRRYAFTWRERPNEFSEKWADEAPAPVAAERDNRPHIVAMRAALTEAMRELSARQYRVVSARLNGDTIEQVQADLGLTVDQIEAAWCEARSVLRRRLNPSEADLAAARPQRRRMCLPNGTDPARARQVAATLPEATRRVALAKLDGADNRQIAAQLGCPVPTVAGAWHRACLAFTEAGVIEARPRLSMVTGANVEGRTDEPISLDDAVAQLPPATRRIVRLKLTGMHDREVAAAIGRASGTVASTWSRARRQLAALGVLPTTTPAAPAAMPAAA
ncbi:sigma factor-like helix-turn-helix DNA-binding protein [Actinocatenispora sera]|uniref:sigma factor-like helix-turn-helix DNA-binding protein n=1 Tax=Actinocatenispora sera TaxID=390989 RepID=UPI0033CF24B9